MKKPFFALWILTLALFVFSWVYLPGLSKYRDLHSKQEQIETELKQLEEKLRAIKEERDLLKNDVQYLEKVIRDELGLVKPGEVVYKFVPDKPRPQEKIDEAAKAIEAQNEAAAEGTALAPEQGFTVAARKIVEERRGISAAPSAPALLESVDDSAVPSADDDSLGIAVNEPSDDGDPVYPRREVR